MQTELADFIRSTPAGEAAEAILRKCVHCGFCSATCPTYQLLGDELDAPRGRIYLIKQMLEGAPVSERTRTHLDRCLTCRSCETTCPSGVAYGQLVDIGREVAEARAPRPVHERLWRRLLVAVFRRRWLFGPAVALGRCLRPLLPARLRAAVPPAASRPGHWPAPRHARRMIALAGCVQPVLGPDINAAAARVLDRLGISLVSAPAAACCGSLAHHMTLPEAALDDVRALIDAWWPLVEAGAEAIVMTASGCGSMVRDYGRLMAHDPAYRDKAVRVSALARDLTEVIAAEPALDTLVAGLPTMRVAFQIPCSLQHGQRLRTLAESLMLRAGFDCVPVADAHLCCGSAGSYSILQSSIAERLREAKLAALEAASPDLIIGANIGCIAHLGAQAGVPVRHWISALDERLAVAG
jgi:glycolate oxidase iron-sulfur subunit